MSFKDTFHIVGLANLKATFCQIMQKSWNQAMRIIANRIAPRTVTKIAALKTMASLAAFLLIACAPVQAAGEKPSDNYKAYLARLYYAKSIKDIAPFFFQPMRDHFNSLVGEDAIAELKNWKGNYVSKFKVIKEEVINDRAFIEGEGIALSHGKPVKAHVRAEMYRESGTWRVRSSVWTGTQYNASGR